MVDDLGRWLQPPKFEAEISKCPGCETLEMARKAIPEGDRVSRARLVPFNG